MWHLYLPIAGNSVNIFLIFAMGAFVGLLSGIFGVGGGFLMTPLLIMAGIPPTVAAASDSNQIVGASTSGTLAHYRLGNVDFKMGILLLVGGVLGGTAGVYVIKALRHMGNADFLIQITYVLMLGFVGIYMFMESFQGLRRKVVTETGTKKESRYALIVKRLPWQTYFERSGVELSVLIRRYTCRYYGRWRRIYHGPRDGVSFENADARRGGNQPFSNSFYVRRCNHYAGQDQPYRGFYAGTCSFNRFQPGSPVWSKDKQEIKRGSA
jgi:hypothetical protein